MSDEFVQRYARLNAQTIPLDRDEHFATRMPIVRDQIVQIVRG